MPFDIASLPAFAPAHYQCEKCLALLTGDFSSLGFRLDLPPDKQSPTCPICRVTYLPTKDFPMYAWEAYIARRGPVCLNTKEALAQAQQLAAIAQGMRCYQQQIDSWVVYTPLRGIGWVEAS